MSVKVAAIVAMAENRCIGKDNKMPWHIPEDLKRFKTLTMDSVVIMGRKTFESILGYLGKPLPGRTSIIISRSGYEIDGAITCSDIEGAIAKGKDIATEKGLEEIFIGGGSQIYELAMPYLDRLYLTKIHVPVDGDTFFPEFGAADWQEASREDVEADPPYSFITYDKAGS